MPQPFVRFRGPDGLRTVLLPEDLIGRMAKADLRINDPRISEAHALLSLRGLRLQLIGLGKARLRSQREDGPRLTLAQGDVVTLAPGVELEAEEVSLPTSVWRIQGPDGASEELLRSQYTVTADGRLEAGYRAEGLAWLWSAGDGWFCQVGAGARRPLLPGVLQVAPGVALQVADQAPRGAESTIFEASGPLRIVTHFDMVHIYQGERRLLTLTAKAAVLFRLLAEARGPESWSYLASKLWPELDRALRRKPYDRTLERLRGHLAAAGLRRDLVRSFGPGVDQRGRVQLMLGPEDIVVDGDSEEDEDL